MKRRILICVLIIVIILVGALLINDIFPNVFNVQKKRPSTIEIKNNNGAFGLTVDGKPYLIQGVCYQPIPVGKGGDFNFWGDPNKPWQLDGRLMKEMGVNTVRFYRSGKDTVQVLKVLDDLYYRYGIRAMIGTYLGFWDWPPPNYADEECRSKVKREFLDMVRSFKDHPGILFWVIGNENNYSFDRDIQRWSTDAIDKLASAEDRRIEKAKIYYSFVNEIAKEAKRIDLRHPVVMGVGETKSLDIAKRECPDIDIIGMIAYRGPTFGNMFRQVRERFDRPLVLIEYGADSFNAATQEPDEQAQSEFIELQWADIKKNSDRRKGEGNCLGGTIFEWNDEWWKANENYPNTWTIHDTAGHWQNTSYHFDAYGADKLNMNEEWWGLVCLNPKTRINGVDERIPKKSYFALKKLWANK